jgi:hypothetical protein
VDDESDLEGQLSGWGNNEALSVAGCWINNLEARDGEGTSFTSTRLSLFKMLLIDVLRGRDKHNSYNFI